MTNYSYPKNLEEDEYSGDDLFPAYDISAWKIDDAMWMKQRKRQWRDIQKNLEVFDLRYKQRAYPLLKNFFLYGEHNRSTGHDAGIGGGGFLGNGCFWVIMLHPDNSTNIFNEIRYKRYRNEKSYIKSKLNLIFYLIGYLTHAPAIGDSLFNHREDLLFKDLIDYMSIDNYNHHPDSQFVKSDYLSDNEFYRSPYFRVGICMLGACERFLENSESEDYPGQFPHNYSRGVVKQCLPRLPQYLSVFLEWVNHYLNNPEIDKEEKWPLRPQYSMRLLMRMFHSSTAYFRAKSLPVDDELVDEVLQMYETHIYEPIKSMHPDIHRVLVTEAKARLKNE
ncbi:MAG: hypothetical protein GY694_03440 [Gammaproteobacteria bacterium]|nr:hypothetical protein [Gammaproteobacteria bacterium]